jgi:hypothetical protein
MHYQIGRLLVLSKKLVAAIGLLQVIHRRRPSEMVSKSIRQLLAILGIYVGFLEKLFGIDSFVADIPEDEEVHDEE